MNHFDKPPKLMYKKYYEGFSERDKNDSLTKEDLDNRVDAFERFINTYTSKEFQDFKKNDGGESSKNNVSE